MIEVGKIITQAANRYQSTPERSVSVSMNEQAIRLDLQYDDDAPRVSMYPHQFIDLTSEQAIELGQILLKAAEVQPEYAEATKKLRDEQTKLDAGFKDMISGLGLECEVDIVDARGTFRVIEAG